MERQLPALPPLDGLTVLSLCTVPGPWSGVTTTDLVTYVFLRVDTYAARMDLLVDLIRTDPQEVGETVESAKSEDSRFGYVRRQIADDADAECPVEPRRLSELLANDSPIQTPSPPKPLSRRARLWRNWVRPVITEVAKDLPDDLT